MKEKNLICESWYNPFFAIATNGNGYELSDIIIYDERGPITESGRGWFSEEFNNNNSFKDGAKIQPIQLRKQENFSRQENFLIHDKEHYQNNKYKLFIYYKNVNFKIKEVKSGGYWIEGVYTIEIEEKTLSCSTVFGSTSRTSDAKKFEYYKIIDELQKAKYNKLDDVKTLIKDLNKKIREYEKTLTTEPDDIKKDITPFLYDGAVEKYKRFIQLQKGGAK